MNEAYYSNGYYVPHKDSHATVFVLYEEEYTKLNDELNPNGDKKFGCELAKLFQEAFEIILLIRTGEYLKPECLSEGWMEENFEDLPQLNQRVFKLVESAFDKVADKKQDVLLASDLVFLQET
jgi:hypothetical protein